MTALIAAALAIWGILLPWTITWNEMDTQPPGYDGNYLLAFAAVTIYPNEPHPVACNITFITPHIANLTPHQLQNVVTHESGHCLGILGHLTDGHTGVMTATLGYEFSEWDRWALWQARGAPFRLYVAY